MFPETVLQELQINKALTIQITPKYRMAFSPLTHPHLPVLEVPGAHRL